MMDESLKILSNKKLTTTLYKLILSSKKIARKVKPGHFLMVKIGNAQDPLLRRPFSIYRATKGKIEILYQVLGKGTALLAKMKKDEFLQAMGPLGNGFNLKVPRKNNILVSGGVGVAPLIFLSEKIRVTRFIIGDKNKKEILPKKEIKIGKRKVIYSTDDGSMGKKGFASQILEKLVEDTKDKSRLYLYVCGPRPMTDAVLDIAKRYSLKGEVSMDERMACGVGACLGCVVKTKNGYKASCKEGPVFNFEELIF